jgi:ketosteroid isomerase-like protein
MANTNADPRQTLQAFTRTVETLELEKIAEYFEEDAQMFSPLGAFPARLDGRAAIMNQFKAIVETARNMPAPLKIEALDLNVREFGDLALLTFHLKLQGPLHRRSFLMRRTGGRWRIAHIHASSASTTL